VGTGGVDDSRSALGKLELSGIFERQILPLQNNYMQIFHKQERSLQLW
jgi:hypothetical protein